MNQEGVVTEDFTVPPAGRYYTINILKKIGPNYMVDQLFVVLFNINYRIWIHDPNFFIITENPTFVPALLKVLEPNRTSSHYYCLTLTEVEELDIPEDPCNSDYNFQACVMESLSSQVGCRTEDNTPFADNHTFGHLNSSEKGKPKIVTNITSSKSLGGSAYRH